MRSLAYEVPFDIPDSWEWVRIRSLGEIVRGSGIKRNETVPQGCPCVRYGELYTTYQTSFTAATSFISAELDEKCKHFSYGDVLMTLTGENKPDIAKAVAYLGANPVAAGGDLAFWTRHGMNPLFLSYIMASPYIISRKVALATGDIIVHISGDKLGTILLPVPPLAEQEKIVARIQNLELVIKDYAQKATILQALEGTFPETLKKSILQEAVQGKLVPQDPSDEPAEALLERIRAEKQRLIKEGKIKKDKHESIIFRRDNSHYEKLDGVERCIDDELPFEIPETWAWVRIGTILSVSSGDSLTGAQMNSAGSIPVYGGNGIAGTHDKWNVCHRTLVIGRVGYYCGATHITEPFAWVTDNAFITHFDEELLQMKWLKFLIDYLEPRKRASATAQPVISGKLLYPMLVPLPPLSEQHRIVQRIEELLPLIKGL